MRLSIHWRSYRAGRITQTVGLVAPRPNQPAPSGRSDWNERAPRHHRAPLGATARSASRFTFYCTGPARGHSGASCHGCRREGLGLPRDWRLKSLPTCRLESRRYVRGRRRCVTPTFLSAGGEAFSLVSTTSRFHYQSNRAEMRPGARTLGVIRSGGQVGGVVALRQSQRASSERPLRSMTCGGAGLSGGPLGAARLLAAREVPPRCGGVVPFLDRHFESHPRTFLELTSPSLRPEIPT